MSAPTLVILAAGMASRYGSQKQTEGFGPNGETIMDYSIYDAIRAGFGKVVFIIREDFSEAFQVTLENPWVRWRSKPRTTTSTSEADTLTQSGVFSSFNRVSFIASMHLRVALADPSSG